MPLGTEVGLAPGDNVLGTPLPPKKTEHSTLSRILAHVYCDQTVGWIKMKLGREVGICPGHIVLDGDPAPLLKGAQQPPSFRPMSIVVAHLSYC